MKSATKEQEYNCKVINSHIGYGYPKEASKFIFTIEEQSGMETNDSIIDNFWKTKFHEVYSEAYNNSSNKYYYLNDISFQVLNQKIKDYDRKMVNSNKLYGRIRNIYSRFIEPRKLIENTDIGGKNAKMLFCGVIYPIAKKSTNDISFSAVDKKLFGLKDFNEWKCIYYNKRIEIIKTFYESIRNFNRPVQIYTFNGNDIVKCKELFESIFGTKGEYKEHTKQGKYLRYYYHHKTKNIDAFNCFSLSNGALSNAQIMEIFELGTSLKFLDS